MKLIRTAIVQSHLQTKTNNKVISVNPPKTNAQEQTLPRFTKRTLAQLRASKCPLLIEYLHKISTNTHPTQTCSSCYAHTYRTNHLFTCQPIHTTLIPISLWEDPEGATDLFPARLWCWGEARAAVREAARPGRRSGVVDTTTEQTYLISLPF